MSTQPATLNSQLPVRRTLHPEIRVLDTKGGICEYVASDETLDSYKEIIRASGWRFSMFAKNAPFVDSHNYESIEKQLGKVIDFKIVGKQLVETVQWAKDVAENKLAQLGWKMTEGGFLKAVSVGFWPVKWLAPYGDTAAAFISNLQEIGQDPNNNPCRCIYTEQEQVELSACIIGANPNALAKAYKAGALDDADLDTLSLEHAKRETAFAPFDPAAGAAAAQRARFAFQMRIMQLTQKL